MKKVVSRGIEKKLLFRVLALRNTRSLRRQTLFGGLIQYYEALTSQFETVKNYLFFYQFINLHCHGQCTKDR